jgi:hypothetical protein
MNAHSKPRWVSRERIERVTRVYGGWTVVSSSICLPLRQGYEGSSRVRQAGISRDRWGMGVVDKVRPLGQLIEAQAGAMRQRPVAGHQHLATADHAEW